MPLLIANNVTSTLASAATNVATSLTVQSGDAGLFPAPAAGEFFMATLVDASLNREIVKCTSRTGAVLTVVRAQENTLARAWNVGDRISLQLTAGSLAALETPDAINNAVAKTSPVDADKFSYWDSVTGKLRALTWANFYEAVRTKLGAMISSSSAKTTPVDADQFALSDSAAGNGPAKLSWLNLKATMFAAWGALIAAATAKTTPVGADMIEVADSAASNATKKVTLANLVANLGVIIAALTAKTTPVDADGILLVDSAASNVSKWTTLTQLWTNYLKAKADALYRAWTVRVFSEASNATPAPNAGSYDQHNVTAAAANMTVGAPSGSPGDGQKFIFRFKDNGTARTIAWNAIFRAVGVSLPATTVISKTLYVGCIYNSADSKWDVVAVGLEA